MRPRGQPARTADVDMSTAARVFKVVDAKSYAGQ
jgi:hypothetical protein